MTAYRVLIVDDQHDVRHMLRSGLETLAQDIEVIDVPSGEEAILVISRQPIDLLVTDVRLPGISGLELQERTQVRNPNLKLILITGVMEPRLRREVANAGADAFFFKPVELSDFLEAACNCLGIPALAGGAALDEAGELPTLSERLRNLHRDVDASAVMLIDDHGEIVAQTETLPENLLANNFIPSVMAISSAASKVSDLVSTGPFKDLLYFVGEPFDFVVSHVDGAMVLLLALPEAGGEVQHLAKCMHIIRQAVRDLQMILAEMGVSIDEPEEVQPDTIEQPVEEEVDISEILPEIEDLFGQVEKQGYKPEEVDAFWDSMADSSAETEHMTRADVISYEQAQKLGLAPDEE